MTISRGRRFAGRAPGGGTVLLGAGCSRAGPLPIAVANHGHAPSLKAGTPCRFNLDCFTLAVRTFSALSALRGSQWKPGKTGRNFHRITPKLQQQNSRVRRGETGLDWIPQVSIQETCRGPWSLDYRKQRDTPEVPGVSEVTKGPQVYVQET